MMTSKTQNPQRGWIPYAVIGGLAFIAGAWLWLQELDLKALRINRSDVSHQFFEMDTRWREMDGRIQSLQYAVDQHKLWPHRYKQVLTALLEYTQLPSEQATLLVWEEKLAAHQYIAEETHVVDYDSLQASCFGAKFLLAGVTASTAPVFPVYGGHFLVITELTYSTLFIADLESQSVSPLTRQTFLDQWTGQVITLRPLLVTI